MSISAEHKILNKMKLVSEIFVNTLITVKIITEEIEKLSKIEIDNGNCSIENNEVYKKFNEIFVLYKYNSRLIRLQGKLFKSKL